MRGGVGAVGGLLVVGMFLPGAMAQTSDPAAHETVSWTVAAPAQAVKPGSRATLTLKGAVEEGWHVYALKQLPNGPTPLRVTLDQNAVASANGAPAGSPATKIHDQGFNLDTQFYSHAFTVTLPVRVSAHPAAGTQSIPVSVRFQTCNDRVCQPPKTVHLTAAISIAG